MGDITHILLELERGETGAANRLIEVVYDELRQLAALRLSREYAEHTLQATALVHEAWLSLGGVQQPNWRTRAHFFGAAAEAMRRILIGRARRRLAARRGGGRERVNLDDLDLAVPAQDDDQLLALNDALDRFTTAYPEKGELVKLRYFVGLNLDEAAETLAISVPTAKRWWAFARAWLFNAISPG